MQRLAMKATESQLRAAGHCLGKESNEETGAVRFAIIPNLSLLQDMLYIGTGMTSNSANPHWFKFGYMSCPYAGRNTANDSKAFPGGYASCGYTCTFQCWSSTKWGRPRCWAGLHLPFWCALCCPMRPPGPLQSCSACIISQIEEAAKSPGPWRFSFSFRDMNKLYIYNVYTYIYICVCVDVWESYGYRSAYNVVIVLLLYIYSKMFSV